MTAWVLTVLTACTLNIMRTWVDFEKDFISLIKSQKQTAFWTENEVGEEINFKTYQPRQQQQFRRRQIQYYAVYTFQFKAQEKGCGV